MSILSDMVEKEFTERLPLGSYVHRFVDTKAARSLVQGQPADYLVGLPGEMRLGFAEVKLCNEERGFPFSNLRIAQKSTMAICVRMGLPYDVYIKCGWSKTWYKVPGLLIVGTLTEGRKSLSWNELENYKWP